MAHFECGSLVQGQVGHGQAGRVLDDADSCTMQLRMHKQVCLVHVPLDKGLVLLRVSTSNDQVVLRCDEPDELFEPEDCALDCLNLLLLKLLKVSLRVKSVSIRRRHVHPPCLWYFYRLATLLLRFQWLF